MTFTRLALVTGICALALTAGCGDAEEEGGAPDVGKSEPRYHPGMLDRSQAAEEAPATFKVKFETSKGEFVVEVTREWAPIGADRFYNLAKIGYFEGVKFFRVIRDPKPFMAQFGLHPDPAVNAVWSDATLTDDPVKKTNGRGYVTYAKTKLPNSRSVQLFINYANNTFLDKQGFAPFGRVIEGMDVVDGLYAGYGGEPSRLQGEIKLRGNAALDKYPLLDWIERATIIE